MAMRHFVQYHNPDRVGPLPAVPDDLSVYTNKPFSLVAALPGHTIWLIAGEGRPRTYSLCYAFVVDEIGESPHPYFAWYARGTEGRVFQPAPCLDHEPWFGAFLRRQANFSLGLRELRPEDVIWLSRHLQRSTPFGPSEAGGPQ